MCDVSKQIKPKNIPVSIFKNVALFHIISRCIEVIHLNIGT